MNILEGGQIIKLLVLVDAVGEIRLLVVVKRHDRVDHNVFQNLHGGERKDSKIFKRKMKQEK